MSALEQFGAQHAKTPAEDMPVTPEFLLAPWQVQDDRNRRAVVAAAEFMDLTPASGRVVRKFLDKAKANDGALREQAGEWLLQRR